MKIASGTALSVAANSTSANLVVNSAYLFTGKGRYTLVAKPSVTGMNVSFKHGGFPICDDQSISNFGATGSITPRDNTVFQENIVGNPAANDLRFRNTTAGAITVDYDLYID